MGNRNTIEVKVVKPATAIRNFQGETFGTAPNCSTDTGVVHESMAAGLFRQGLIKPVGAADEDGDQDGDGEDTAPGGGDATDTGDQDGDAGEGADQGDGEGGGDG